MVDAARNPTIEVGSRSVSTNDASFALLGVGPGVTYYFMPANIHLGGTLLLSQATLKSGKDTIAETDWGFGAVGRVGKDFWVGKDWGLGILGQFSVASMKDKGSSAAPNWTGMAASVAFAGTFN
jgi:hypothetical protein